jgi:hypothetical protein
MNLTDDEIEVFWHRVHKTQSCWIWTAAASNGYGLFNYHGYSLRAHRVAYALANGGIPTGLVIDHLCADKLCVNPSHLEAVTASENSRRAHVNGQTPRPVFFPWKPRTKQTHCAMGHELTEENVYVYPSSGNRRCRICLAADQRRAYLRRKSKLTTPAAASSPGAAGGPALPGG